MSQSCNNGLKNVQKSVMHVQSCSFTNINLSRFCRSRCRRHRCCLSSLLLSSQKWATMVTCRHSSPLYCKLFQVGFTDFCAQIVQINEHKSEPAHFALNTIPYLSPFPDPLQFNYFAPSQFFHFSSTTTTILLFPPRTTTLRGMGTHFRCNNFRDRLGGQALLMIG